MGVVEGPGGIHGVAEGWWSCRGQSSATRVGTTVEEGREGIGVLSWAELVDVCGGAVALIGGRWGFLGLPWLFVEGWDGWRVEQEYSPVQQPRSPFTSSSEHMVFTTTSILCR